VIVCVRLNPALDRCIRLAALGLHQVNRATSAEASPGCKAANVALAARALGARVRYVALLGGPTGQAVEQGLSTRGVEVEAVSARAATRVNLELIDEQGVTEVLEPGIAPAPEELTELMARCAAIFREGSPSSVVALSGSLPPTVDASVYVQLIRLAKSRGLRVILDTSGVWLERGLAARPHFVKPNREEAEALLGCRIAGPLEAKAAALELVRRGAEAAIVSLGPAGLVGSDEQRARLVVPPAIEARSAVACGDAAVAGLAVALERGDDRPEQLAFAAACGAANCRVESPGDLDPATGADQQRRIVASFVDEQRYSVTSRGRESPRTAKAAKDLGVREARRSAPSNPYARGRRLCE
jgi:1-phosphofructokinase family hexose kinase